MESPKFHATDYALASSVGREIIVGEAFAFVGRKALAHPSLAWVGTFAGTAGPLVLPLDARGTALPGVTVTPATPKRLALRALASDKRLYQENKDPIHLLVVEPEAAEMEVRIEVCLGETVVSKQRVRLDARGCGALLVRDLPAGDYTARFRSHKESTCTFIVAEYRLAPLVARLVDRRLAGSALAIELGLTSFGEPVDGPIVIDVLDGGRRASRVKAESQGGRATATVKLDGAGPHELVVQLERDPSRTANVPIVGSRAEERSETTFSELGTVVTGTLLPRDGAREVRGVYLAEGAIATTPLRLEKVVARRARLVATTALERPTIVVVDASFPERRKNAVDAPTAPHPAQTDPKYVAAEALFKGKRYKEAGDAFAAAREASKTAHPNYAYYIACCDALTGNRESARRWLHEALRDGWVDLAHMAADEDLASLRGWEPFEALARGGRKVVALPRLAAGEAVEIDVPDPLALVLCGAWVGDAPWEGWACVLTPSELAVTATAPENPAPGSRVRVEVRADRAASVYAIVKDARLSSADTAASRLAAAAKAYAAEAAERLKVGKPTRTLAEACPPPPPPAPPMFAAMPAQAFGGIPRGSFDGDSPRMARPVGLASPVAPARAAGPPMPRAAVPMMAPPPNVEGAAPYREPAARPAALPEEEPEVLFAGFVALEDGRGGVEIDLPQAAADYVVEVFGIAGLDWTAAEARFRAEKATFASLDLPPFVHPEDVALGRLHFGSVSSRARVRVTCAGVDVPLVHEGAQVNPSAPLAARRGVVSFLAAPGEYEAIVEDASGAIERARARVEVPGKLRRQVRTMKLLEAGELISRADDPSIVSLRILPGLDKPFKALVDATADYGHACCEQTAAKLLSACAMWIFANGESTRRQAAESIVLAGIRRERTMWLEGRGFKMYPESSDVPDRYWGPKAARHLFHVASLDDAGATLHDAAKSALEMAGDAARAYAIEWPPKRAESCEDAYAMARFGQSGGDAVGFVAERRAALLGGRGTPGGAVAMRAELAYAAATLLRAGKGAHMKDAIAMTNVVTSAFGDGGRLYSTVDSAAAIALMAELTASGIVTGAGDLEVDGKATTTKDAAMQDGPIDRVAVVRGLCPVEVTKWVEEDWSTLRGDVTMRLSLEKAGAPARAFAPLDAIDLRIRLEGGYKPGDLAWVCLPGALSRVVGGGQVKRFSVDFAGKDELVVPLAATSVTIGRAGAAAPQRFAVAVRNMFEEERGASAGFVEITVAPEQGGVLARALSGLRALFS